MHNYDNIMMVISNSKSIDYIFKTASKNSVETILDSLSKNKLTIDEPEIKWRVEAILGNKKEHSGNIDMIKSILFSDDYIRFWIRCQK